MGNLDVAHEAGKYIYSMLERGVKPRDIMTKDAFENAIRLVLSMGGSTNAVLHLLAMAREAEVDLTIEDFDRLSLETPYLTDLRPGGKYVMSDVDRSGGVQRGLCGPGDSLGAGAWNPHGESQRERGFAGHRTPAGRHRGSPGRHRGPRTAAEREPLRPRHPVHRRGHGEQNRARGPALKRE